MLFMTTEEFKDPSATKKVMLAREPVELYKILKFESLVNSGAEAKLVIDDGLVSVNGELELRRRRKIRENDIVEFDGVRMFMGLLQHGE
jgi:ribosome-associated protein